MPSGTVTQYLTIHRQLDVCFICNLHKKHRHHADNVIITTINIFWLNGSIHCVSIALSNLLCASMTGKQASNNAICYYLKYVYY